MAKSKETKTTALGLGDEAFYEQAWVRKVLCGGYTDYEKLLFLLIADCGEEGCSMTNEELGEKLSRFEDGIRRAITSLSKDGAVSLAGRKGDWGRIYAAAGRQL